MPTSLWNWLRSVRARLVRRYAIPSYSYSGEDMVLRAIFKKQKIDRGFYVDVGAYHPRQFSNTHYFYKHGWCGLNVDARPGSMELFRRLRPRDINIEAAVTNDEQEMSLFVFESASLNTLDGAIAESRASAGHKIVREERIKTWTLAEVLTRHLNRGQQIDFLSVDVEGYDLEVLKSNDWDAFRPSYVVLECEIEDIEEVRGNACWELMREKGYQLVPKTMSSLVFHRADSDTNAA